MKFLTWNIRSGGFNDYSFNLKIPERLADIVEVVKNSNADFVSLIDTYRWDTYFTGKEISELFGYKYVYCINLEDGRLIKLGHNNGITILTNINDPYFATIRIVNRNIIKTHFNHNGSYDIFSIYLDDLSEDTRLKQISTLQKHLSAPNRTIITGDLNTVAKEDVRKTKILLKDFYKKYPHLQKKFSKKITDMMKSKVVELIKDFGFHDAASEFVPTVPTPEMTIGCGAVFRLDYFFVGKDIKITDFKVIKNEQTDIASDHYPIRLEII